jgi:hypothetical protein
MTNPYIGCIDPLATNYDSAVAALGAWAGCPVPGGWTSPCGTVFQIPSSNITTCCIYPPIPPPQSGPQPKLQDPCEEYNTWPKPQQIIFCEDHCSMVPSDPSCECCPSDLNERLQKLANIK